MKKLLFAALFALQTVAHAQTNAKLNLPKARLSVGIHAIEAEVANTFTSRTTGLMFRKKMEPNHGMVFVFPEVDRHCMWMKNTLLPLSVAFFDAQGTIINIEDMEPQTENIHCSTKPTYYALEMNKGWFSARNIAPGARISGVEKLPTANP